MQWHTLYKVTRRDINDDRELEMRGDYECGCWSNGDIIKLCVFHEGMEFGIEMYIDNGD